MSHFRRPDLENDTMVNDKFLNIYTPLFPPCRILNRQNVLLSWVGMVGLLPFYRRGYTSSTTQRRRCSRWRRSVGNLCWGSSSRSKEERRPHRTARVPGRQHRNLCEPVYRYSYRHGREDLQELLYCTRLLCPLQHFPHRGRLERSRDHQVSRLSHRKPRLKPCVVRHGPTASCCLYGVRGTTSQISISFFWISSP